MELTEYEVRQKTARIFRAARKSRGYKQIDISSAMNVNQGTISKLENGILTPDAGTWYKFCKLLNLEPDLTYRSGYLFSTIPSKQFCGGKFFKKEKSNGLITVKECIPFINVIHEFNLMDQFEIVLKKKQIDRDILAIAEYKIPIRVLTIIFDFLNEQMPELDANVFAAQYFIQDLEFLVGSWSKTKAVTTKAMEKLIRRIEKIEDIFNYDIDDSSIQLNLKKPSELITVDENFLKSYIAYRANLLKTICTDVLALKDVKLSHTDQYNYVIEYTI